MTRMFRTILLASTVLSSLLAGCATAPHARSDRQCTSHASDACYAGFELPAKAGRMHYYASLPAGTPEAHSVLLIMHGHPRDANRSFNAALDATRKAGELEHTLVIAPLYQVASGDAKRCSTKGAPRPEQGDALWTCSSWLAGEDSQGADGLQPISAIAALDALITHIKQQWPGVHRITLAGFSAGGQMLQRSIGFAKDAPAGVSLRYVIADPGTWLYFDPVRPQPHRDGRPVDWAQCHDGVCQFTMREPAQAASCAGYNNWKYGTQSLPAYLGASAAEARERYRRADISYLEGALDSSDGQGTHYGALDKSCAAMMQGPFRMQRGQAYAAYDQQVLQPHKPRSLTIVPDCAHDVACVLPSDAVREAVFPTRH